MEGTLALRALHVQQPALERCVSRGGREDPELEARPREEEACESRGASGGSCFRLFCEEEDSSRSCMMKRSA